MGSPANDIKTLLDAEATVALTFGTNLFVAHEPDTPNNCVTLFDASGAATDIALDRSEYERPGLQVRVRNEDYVLGFALCEAIKDYLHTVGSVVVNGKTYESIQHQGGPFYLDRDAQGRMRFVINFGIQRR